MGAARTDTALGWHRLTWRATEEHGSCVPAQPWGSGSSHSQCSTPTPRHTTRSSSAPPGPHSVLPTRSHHVSMGAPGLGCHSTAHRRDGIIETRRENEYVFHLLIMRTTANGCICLLLRTAIQAHQCQHPLPLQDVMGPHGADGSAAAQPSHRAPVGSALQALQQPGCSAARRHSCARCLLGPSGSQCDISHITLHPGAQS